MIGREFFRRDPVTCARELVGAVLHWDGCEAVVVETEAYAAEGDEACHTFFRPGAREFVRRHPAGTAYVYLNYGVHWMLNALVKEGGCEGFVLIRALDPVAGFEQMARARGTAAREALCSGPGKLTKALGITGTDHGMDLCSNRARAFHTGDIAQVVATPRIGISRAVELPWRFVMAGNPCVSRPLIDRTRKKKRPGGNESHPA